MGVTSSATLKGPFASLAAWPWNRAMGVVKSYTDGEYDFGVDYSVLMAITGLGIDEAKELLAAHTQNDTGIANILTILITIVSLADSNNRNESARSRAIFDLFDFNHASSISMDELAIMLVCVTSSYSFILDKHEDAVNDSFMIRNAQQIYTILGKKATTPFSVDDMVSYTSKSLFKDQISIDKVLDTFLMGISISSED